MKKCTWCGKEYPDTETLCPVDRQPLQLVGSVGTKESPEPPAADQSGRPAAITIICCLGFMSGLFALAIVVSFGKEIRAVNPLYQPIMALNALAVIASMIGLFKMRRWGLYTYTGLCVMGLILKLAMGGRWNSLFIFALTVQSIIIAVPFAYVRRMK